MKSYVQSLFGAIAFIVPVMCLNQGCILGGVLGGAAEAKGIIEKVPENPREDLGIDCPEGTIPGPEELCIAI